MSFTIDDFPVVESKPLGRFRLTYRVQRIKALPTSEIVHDFVLSPPGTRQGRFDAKSVATAYLALSSDTALIESLARREALFVTLEQLAVRQIIRFKQLEALRLLDMSRAGGVYPDLVSMRYARSQDIAEAANQAGLDGIFYASAQHPTGECLAIFASGLNKFRAQEKIPLISRDGRLLRVAQEVLERANMPLVMSGPA